MKLVRKDRHNAELTQTDAFAMQRAVCDLYYRKGLEILANHLKTTANDIENVLQMTSEKTPANDGEVAETRPFTTDTLIAALGEITESQRPFATFVLQSVGAIS